MQPGSSSAAALVDPASPTRTFVIPSLRWVIASVLLAASVLNYVDRQALSILATTIQRELNLSDLDYAKVVQAFLFCYAATYLLTGRLVDRVGPRFAETAFIALSGRRIGLSIRIVLLFAFHQEISIHEELG